MAVDPPPTASKAARMPPRAVKPPAPTQGKAPALKMGQEYIRSAKRAAQSKGDDDDDGFDDAAQATEDIDKFNARMRCDSDDD